MRYFLFVIFFFSSAVCAFSEETLTLTTYYPSPQGVYRRLMTSTLGVGDNDGSGGLTQADSPDPTVAANAGDLWVAGDVGIGTRSPLQKLSIQAGNIRFGGVSPVFGAEASTVQIGGFRASPDAGNIVFGDGSGWKLHLARATDDASTKYVTFTDQGNVGIGTTAPTRRLEVNGAMRLTPQGAAPVNSQGALYFDSSSDALYVGKQAAWARVLTYDSEFLGGCYGTLTGAPIALTTTWQVILECGISLQPSRQGFYKITHSATGRVCACEGRYAEFQVQYRYRRDDGSMTGWAAVDSGILTDPRDPAPNPGECTSLSVPTPATTFTGEDAFSSEAIMVCQARWYEFRLRAKRSNATADNGRFRVDDVSQEITKIVTFD